MSERMARLDKSVIDMVYPVGAIYMSVNSTNPGNLFGGDWEQIKDRFMLACGDTYAAGSTGGEAEHTLNLDELPERTVVTTIAEEGKYIYGYAEEATGGRWAAIANSDLLSSSGKAHNNMPPYLAVYIWKRTA